MVGGGVGGVGGGVGAGTTHRQLTLSYPLALKLHRGRAVPARSARSELNATQVAAAGCAWWSSSMSEATARVKP